MRRAIYIKTDKLILIQELIKNCNRTIVAGAVEILNKYWHYTLFGR